MKKVFHMIARRSVSVRAIVTYYAVERDKVGFRPAILCRKAEFGERSQNPGAGRQTTNRAALETGAGSRKPGAGRETPTRPATSGYHHLPKSRLSRSLSIVPSAALQMSCGARAV